ncbi:MAG TPA: hypothetical protein VLK82_24735 [Candidatus Tectomicrobia bacterium]|nr:hypothetical protein [Candidatus Tectomicrobia bacterium]
MNEHPVQWTAPSPLWAAATNATDPAVRQTFNRPAILRFGSDTFMDEFLAILENDPTQVTALVAQPETWRGPLPPVASTASLALTSPQSSLARQLQRLRLVAQRKRQGPAAGISAAPASLPASQTGLKLYQPAHQRYYMVASCLVCRLVGLPDRTLDSARQERVSFVVRRLVHPDQSQTTAPCDPDSCDEYALVQTPRGSVWRQVSKAHEHKGSVLIPGEEQLPLFAVHFRADDGHRRRLLAGLIPVGKREAYLGAAKEANGQVPGEQATGSPGGSGVSPTDPRMILLYTQVTEPWKRLLERAEAVRVLHEGEPSPLPPAPPPDPPPDPPAPTPGARHALLKTTREQIQTVSWYIVLDLVNYLKQYVPEVWKVVIGQQPATTLSDPNALNLLTALTGTTAHVDLITALTADSPIYTPEQVQPSLRRALQDVGAVEGALEGATAPYDREPDLTLPPPPGPSWPEWLFPLADPLAPAPLPPVSPAPTGTPLEAAQQRIDQLAELVRLALPLQAATPMPAPALASQQLLQARDGWFVLRCVFECPNCGPLEPPVVSIPTQPFRMAGFFDPDAPARPIRVALPIDTSPAGLRKFDKNTAFMVSDMLCGQIDRLKGLTLGDLVRSVLPWPFHKELSVPEKGPCTDPDDPSLSLGMVCSLSIPIITICALILLMIIVNLLDIIFRWLPYFFICFPLPGFKAKE